MKYPTIRIEGSIFSADIINKIEQGDLPGQTPKDFRISKQNVKVKDEIVKARSDAQDMFRIFNRKMEAIPEDKPGTSETRNFWMTPLLGLLGYDIQLNRSSYVINEKRYPISHYDANLHGFPIHIVGYNDSLDSKRKDRGLTMSPHSLLQEYLNLTEHLYGIVTNGKTLRLLRNSSRLIKLSFVEFDLDQMFSEDIFTDFAVMFRLLHSSRMPLKPEEGAESLIERYHQDSLESGSRIREKLSEAVELSIAELANGFLSHPANKNLRELIIESILNADDYYGYLLNLIYRILFLMVIEERNLIFEESVPRFKREIYYNYYSVSRIRNLSEKRYLSESQNRDLWINLKNCFILFEASFFGAKLDIKPLAGELFSPNAIAILNLCSIDNQVLLKCLRNLSLFTNPNTGQITRVNYGSLNVEEFGSVYEGLLEYDPFLDIRGSDLTFSFKKGDKRSSSGSHYTPDELVQPLIKNSLEHIIADKLQTTDPEKGLLSITVCDAACGSGHILLNAARSIAHHLAKVRTGEDQPSPPAFRKAVRDVIQHCIYGVDKNPLAVELAKVALWLEAHNPGEPLNFLDHHIKCGDAIVGLAHIEELEKGIPDEAFNPVAGDDKDICRQFKQRNSQERKRGQMLIDYSTALQNGMNTLTSVFSQLDAMPEHTPAEIEAKRKRYTEIISGSNYWNFKTLADIINAQFFIPKTVQTAAKLITDGTYYNYLQGEKTVGQAVAAAQGVAASHKFFHWFIEFSEIFSNGGFDCILGNPPFLGGQKLTGTFGNSYCQFIRYNYAPIGSVDLVTYFFRRIFTLLKENGFQGLISTNTIAQGNAREGGLDVIQKQGGTINSAFRSMKWPGLAAVEVSLLTIFKGKWNQDFILDNKKVTNITTYLDDTEDLGKPYQLEQNAAKSFQGSIVLGKGFILTPQKAAELIDLNPRNKDVLFPYLNGEDLNSNVDQAPSRWVINFFDWDEDYCRNNYPECFEILEREVKPERQRWSKDKNGNDNVGEHALRKPLPEKWWIYAEKRPKLYQTIAPLDKVIVTAQVSKTVAFDFTKTDKVLDAKLVVFALSQYSLFAFLHSSLHYNWAWKYCTTMKADLCYTPTQVFQPFPFPQNLSEDMEYALEQIGEEYHEYRRQLMQRLQLGLTKIYNQCHNGLLTAEIADTDITDRKKLAKMFGKDTLSLYNHLQKTENSCSMSEAVAGIIKLRQLHKQMDELVLKAYGWHCDSQDGAAIDLNHNFYEVDYLPENDRIRYTISPQARKEILKRLLLLNHKIHEQEIEQGLAKNNKNSPNTAKNKNTAKVEETDDNYNRLGSLMGLTEPESEEKAIPDNEYITTFFVGQQIIDNNGNRGEVTKVTGTGHFTRITVKDPTGQKEYIAAYTKFKEEK